MPVVGAVLGGIDFALIDDFPRAIVELAEKARLVALVACGRRRHAARPRARSRRRRSRCESRARFENFPTPRPCATACCAIARNSMRARSRPSRRTPRDSYRRRSARDGSNDRPRSRRRCRRFCRNQSPPMPNWFFLPASPLLCTKRKKCSCEPRSIGESPFRFNAAPFYDLP